MRAAWAALAAPLLFVVFARTAVAQTAPGAPDADAAARSAIDACVARIDNAPLGLPDLEQRCPDLPAALQAAGVRPLIIDSSRSRFNRNSLWLLRNLIHGTQGPAPAVAALAPVLRGLHPPAAVSRSWWVRLLEWLGEHLSNRQNFNPPTWFSGVLRALAKMQWLWTAIIWITVLALPVAVAVIVMREVRAMGRQSVDDPVAAGEMTAAGPEASRLALLRQMPLAQRPAQLFAMLISRLVAAGRLPPDRSLTHREVARRARLEDPEQRHLINQLARLSERQLYSGSATSAAGADEVLARGEDLYTTGWGRPVEP
ncbi:MAG TPA: DUF4129 domain-containing protein [Steroidobacteraceae bacterium]|nr:DUF4129 domain-containing protein [Steroidobacteraceae bacterium]